ncbi:MAG TPA: T9SS type A sorting domain-containing protein [Bacteroidia bacterium]|nr:T9SS type A sorting domain-containing protein [Bacteroidia bacterium]HRF14700.1 T9SS type A sorting domain-containing protein [Bacteroidia bacterium]
MKRKLFISTLLLLSSLNSFSQCEYIEDSTALRTIGNISATLCNSNFTYCSKNGFSLFPHTNYRVLNIMINIIYDVNPSWDPYYQATPGANDWNPGTPNTINSNPPAYLSSFMDQDFNTLPPQGIMTRKYYESSFGALHIVGDFIVVDVPHSYIINNSGIQPPLYLFSSYTLLQNAINIINASGGLSAIFGHNSINDYDYCALGFPGISKNLTSNNMIDFVQILFRNSTSNYGGLKLGQGYTGGGLSSHILIGSNFYTGEVISVQAVGKSPLTNPNGIIIHELAHNLFGGNNFHTSGGHHYGSQPSTTFLGIQGGYGLMGSAGAGLTSVNGYERYRMGWYSSTYNPNQIPIQANGTASDIDQSMGAQTFVLRDFMTTGDVVRIKLPYKDVNALDQYIWLENHKIGSNGMLDYLQFSDSDPCRPQGTPGIYAYMQIGKNILESNNQLDVYPSGEADNLKVISAEGNFDHEQIANQSISCVAWPTSESYHLLESNTLTGDNDQMHIFYNTLTNTINNSNGHAPFIQQRLNNSFDSNIPYLGDNKDAFTNGTVMEIGSNPSPVNLPTFYYALSGSTFYPQTNAPNNRHTYLTGLKISFTQLTGGDFQVDVVWNEYDVKNDVRWCGDIILKEQVNLKANKIITLDQSRTANQINRDAVSGEFTPITTFTCEGGSYFHIESNSQLILENNSVLHLETGSQLSMESGSIVRVKNGCKLILDSKSTVINNGGRIIIEDGGTLTYQEADITLATTNSTLEIAGLLDLKSPVTAAYNIFTFSGLGYLLFNSPLSPSANVACTPGDCIFQLVGGTGQLLLKVTQESLRLPVGLAKFIVEGGVCQFTGYSAARVLGATTKTTLWGTVFTSTTGNYNTHKGLMLYGGAAAVSYSTFLHGYQGIRNLNGDFTVEYSTFQNCGVGVLTDGGSFDINNSVFNQNRGFGISADNMTLPCLLTSNEIKYTTLTNGIGVFFDGSLTSSLYAENNYIHDNIVGMQIKNTQLKGICNSVKNNQTNGIEINQGATLDFSGSPTLKPSNAIQNNDISLKLSVAKNLFLADGYNSLTPIQSGVQKAVRGTIKKTCPNPSAINAIYNEWNTNGTFSTNDYALTTVAGQSGCATAIPVTINDPNPIAFVSCSYTQPLVAAPENPLYDCNNCETIYTSNFNGDKLNEAGVAALQQTTETGGSSDAQAVTLFNEMLMYNLPTPDEKEKYILNYSYAKMGAALGAAFKNNALSITDNTPALSSEVQQMMEVLNKHLAEAIGNGDTLDRFYYSLDKANVYRLAGRRDLAFPILDDMFNWTTASDELDYLNYKNCITHLEQDLIDSIITAEEYMDASLICGQQSSGLRVLSSTIVKQDKSLMAISSTYAAQNITVSPNPATDRLNIYYTQEQPLTIVIKEVTGREIHRSVLNSHSSLDCSQFAKGIYTLQLFDKENIRVYKSKVLLK